jgi:tetratricopeptide (TPR) repeat protein
MAQKEAKEPKISVEIARQRVASAPLDWRSFNDLGVAYYREGLHDEAIAAFEQALALHPITATIEAEQRQQRALDSQRQALVDQQARQQKAQTDAAMNQMFQTLLGGMGSMAGVNAKTLSMLSVAQGMANVASQIPSAPPTVPLLQEKMESSLEAKREVASVYANLGAAHSARKHFSQSIVAFESALNLDPSKTVLLRLMAECNFALADYGKCIVLMKRFLAISTAGVSPKCYMLISDAFQALGMGQEAEKAFDAGVRAYKKLLGANPSAVTMTMELGWAYAERYDRLSEAIECFRRVLAGDKSNSEALKGLATSYYAVSDYDQALKALQVLTGPDVKNENVSYAWYLSGRIYDEMGLSNDALTAFRKAVEGYDALSHRDLPPTYVTTASGAIGQEQAVQRLELAVADDPLGWDTFNNLYGLAFVYEMVGRDVEAIETLNRCLVIRPKHSLARKSLERLTKKKSGACDHALGAADKAVSQNDTTTSMQSLAKAYQLMPDGERKKETQRKLLRMAGQAKSIPPLTEEGQRHFLRGNAALKSAKDPIDIDRAIAEYRWAIVQSPWVGDLYLHASVASGVRHRYSEAIEYLTLFLTASPAATNLEAALNKLYELDYQQAQDIRALSALSHFE